MYNVLIFNTPHKTIRINFTISKDISNHNTLAYYKLFKYTCLWGGFDKREETDKNVMYSWEFDKSILPYFKARFKYDHLVKFDV